MRDVGEENDHEGELGEAVHEPAVDRQVEPAESALAHRVADEHEEHRRCQRAALRLLRDGPEQEDRERNRGDDGGLHRGRPLYGSAYFRDRRVASEFLEEESHDGANLCIREGARASGQRRRE